MSEARCGHPLECHQSRGHRRVEGAIVRALMADTAPNSRLRNMRASAFSGWRSQMAALALGLAALSSTACGAKIGDPCERAFDCSVTQNRQCDVSNADRDPNNEGECTIESCSG